MRNIWMKVLFLIVSKNNSSIVIQIYACLMIQFRISELVCEL